MEIIRSSVIPVNFSFFVGDRKVAQCDSGYRISAVLRLEVLMQRQRGERVGRGNNGEKVVDTTSHLYNGINYHTHLLLPVSFRLIHPGDSHYGRGAS